MGLSRLGGCIFERAAIIPANQEVAWQVLRYVSCPQKVGSVISIKRKSSPVYRGSNVHQTTRFERCTGGERATVRGLRAPNAICFAVAHVDRLGQDTHFDNNKQHTCVPLGFVPDPLRWR